MNLHPVDPDRTAVLQTDQKLPDLSGAPLDFHLHTAVPQILHPAGQTQLLCQQAGLIAESDKLNLSAEKNMPPHCRTHHHTSLSPVLSGKNQF